MRERRERRRQQQDAEKLQQNEHDCEGCGRTQRHCAHRLDGQRLSDLRPGDTGVIQWVGGVGALKRRLVDMGIVPGIQVEVIKVAPLGDPMEITIRGFSLALRKDDAKNIGVGEWRQGCHRRKRNNRACGNCCNHGCAHCTRISPDGEEGETPWL